MGHIVYCIHMSKWPNQTKPNHTLGLTKDFSSSDDGVSNVSHLTKIDRHPRIITAVTRDKTFQVVIWLSYPVHGIPRTKKLLWYICILINLIHYHRIPHWTFTRFCFLVAMSNFVVGSWDLNIILNRDSLIRIWTIICLPHFQWHNLEEYG